MKVKAMMRKYHELANVRIIPCLQDYTQAWLELSRMFAVNDCPEMAGACSARADFYAVQGSGEHIRIIEGSFSELIEV